MSSLRLTTALQQKMVLTPQLRQRIEMLQMTSMELQDLIEQEMVTNPILEEVQSGDEIDEITQNILDQNSDGAEDSFTNGSSVEPLPEGISPEGAGIADSYQTETGSLNGTEPTGADAESGDDLQAENVDAFEEIDYGREFQDYLDPGYRTQEIEYKDDAPSFEQFLTSKLSLSDHLEWQLNMQDVSEAENNAAIAIIGDLDSDGRLNASLEEIARPSWSLIPWVVVRSMSGNASWFSCARRVSKKAWPRDWSPNI